MTILRAIQTYFRSPGQWLILLIAILSGAAIYLTPLLSDDLMFLNGYAYMEPGIDKFKAIWPELCNHYTYDVGRISNLLACIVLCFTTPLTRAIIYTLILCGFYQAFGKVTGATGRNYMYLTIAAIFFGFPYKEDFYTTAYWMNYITTSMLLTWFLARFFNNSQATDSPRKQSLTRSCCIGIIGGWMHESFSVPLCCGLATALLIDNSLRTRHNVIAYISLGIGTVLNFTMPAIWYRVNTSGNTLALQLNGLHLIIPLIILIAITIYFASKRKISKRQTSIAISMIIAAACECIIMFRFYSGLRSAWPMLLFSYIGICHLLSSVRFRLPRPAIQLFKTALSIFAIASLSVTVIYQNKLLDEYNSITTKLETIIKKGEPPIIYHDMLPVSPFVELLTMGRPSTGQFSQWGLYYRHSWNQYNEIPYTILPEVFKEFDSSELTPTPSQKGMYTYRGYLVAETSLTANDWTNPLAVSPTQSINCLGADGKWQNRPYLSLPFTDKDGHEWRYIYLPRRIMFNIKNDCIDARL